MDKLVTDGYLGPQEDTSWQTPWENGNHAADAEAPWVGAQPRSKFAVAYATASDGVRVRRYDTSSGGFLDPADGLELTDMPSRWVRRLGYDDNCSDEIPGNESCAWFAWEAWGEGLIGWRAVGASEGMSFVHAIEGHQPSGDAAKVVNEYGVPTRKKLLAWITPDRGTLKTQLLSDLGEPIPGTELDLYVAQAPFKIYQTAVAWSSKVQRWLVAWTLHAYPHEPARLNGQVLARAVNSNGSAAGPTAFVTYCEGETYTCSPSSMLAGPVGPLENNWCFCKGIWLGSSSYSTSQNDRFRIQHYGTSARLTGLGQVAEVAVGAYGPGGTFWPITEANYSSGGQLYPFQHGFAVADKPSVPHHWRLRQDSVTLQLDAGEAFPDGHGIGQAFRAGGLVAAAVASEENDLWKLRLSIVDVNGTCP